MAAFSALFLANARCDLAVDMPSQYGFLTGKSFSPGLPVEPLLAPVVLGSTPCLLHHHLGCVLSHAYGGFASKSDDSALFDPSVAWTLRVLPSSGSLVTPAIADGGSAFTHHLYLPGFMLPCPDTHAMAVPWPSASPTVPPYYPRPPDRPNSDLLTYLIEHLTRLWYLVEEGMVYAYAVHAHTFHHWGWSRKALRALAQQSLRRSLKRRRAHARGDTRFLTPVEKHGIATFISNACMSVIWNLHRPILLLSLATGLIVITVIKDASTRSIRLALHTIQSVAASVNKSGFILALVAGFTSIIDFSLLSNWVGRGTTFSYQFLLAVYS